LQDNVLLLDITSYEYHQEIKKTLIVFSHVEQPTKS